MRNSGDKPEQFDRLIAVSRRVETEDALGTKAYTWALYRTMWAKKVSVRAGRQVFAAGQTHATVTDIFRVGYRMDLDATMRVTYLGQHYDLAGPPVDVDGAHRVTELLCVSNLGDGRAEAA
jgi:SPP1 family predicted phage head-tail adaptor